MPGPAIHISVMRHVAKALAEAGYLPEGSERVNRGPDVLFADAGQYARIRDTLEAADGPLAADMAGLMVGPNSNLGDPVAFTKYLIWLTTRDPKQKDRSPQIVDWNLDADRGYGYHDWDWNRDPGNSTNDPEGNLFLNPCTWPPQADSPPAPGPYDPGTPLKLHWTGPGLEDPAATWTLPVPVRGLSSRSPPPQGPADGPGLQPAAPGPDPPRRRRRRPGGQRMRHRGVVLRDLRTEPVGTSVPMRLPRQHGGAPEGVLRLRPADLSSRRTAEAQAMPTASDPAAARHGRRAPSRSACHPDRAHPSLGTGQAACR
jgi:hypothetical protein